jgi:hypothetical protein
MGDGREKNRPFITIGASLFFAVSMLSFFSSGCLLGSPFGTALLVLHYKKQVVKELNKIK